MGSVLSIVGVLGLCIGKNEGKVRFCETSTRPGGILVVWTFGTVHIGHLERF